MTANYRTSDSTRVETFSDGVFAIAITLLVLDLRAPADTASFRSDLVAQWPSYLAFIAAFAVLGLIWLSHHDLFSRLDGANASLLLRNLLLLFLVSLYSFPTAVLAASFRVSGTRTNQQASIAMFTVFGIAVTIAWIFLVRVPVAAPHLVSDPVEMSRYAHRQVVYAAVACALLGVAFAAALLSPILSIVLIAVLPVINFGFYRRAQRVPLRPAGPTAGRRGETDQPRG